MRHIVEDNSMEKVTVVTDDNRLSIVTECKGRLPDDMVRYKVTVLNKDLCRRIAPIINQFVNGGLK